MLPLLYCTRPRALFLKLYKMVEESRESLIASLFRQNFSYKEILATLFGKHQIKLSMRQLKRILSSLGLFRRKSNTSFSGLCQVIQNEIQGSGSLLGYRMMQQKLMVVHNIRASRSTVNQIQKGIDPDGVEERKRKRLKRRKYSAKGPNYIWHLDGYDKLKPYGFCIHGCIDGYSRKLLWLECSSTNNCPNVVANYFIEYVKENCGTARIVRADNGTENSNIAAMQRFFREQGTDAMAGQKSFLFGKSTSNQRIEAYWSLLRKSCVQWWMNYFKDMRDEGTWDDSDPVQRECLKFCFSFVIQKELQQVKQIHNTHGIRKYRNQECPDEKPNVMYNLPECFGTIDYKVLVSDIDLDLSEPYTRRKPIFGCSSEFENVALHYMATRDLCFPQTVEEAGQLYQTLIDFVNNF